jgi:hypothetical protein
MLTNQFSEAIAKASLHQLPDLTQTLWKAVTAGAIGWDEAEPLSEQLEVRRRLLTERKAGPLGTYRTSPKDRTRANTEAWARRRRLAASGPMPPGLASGFTTGELAAMRIVADEVRDKGSCDRTLGELAVRAGVSIDTARRAIRQAARLGLITIEERRRYRQPSLSNVVRIVSREWLTWISKGRVTQRTANPSPHFHNQRINHPLRSQGGGWQTCHALDSKDSREAETPNKTVPKAGAVIRP